MGEVVAEHGTEILSDAGQLSSLLSDLLPDAWWIVKVVAAAADGRVADVLAGHLSEGLDNATAVRLTASSFVAATGYQPGICEWLVREIAVAARLITDAEGPGAVLNPPTVPVDIPASEGSPAVAAGDGGRNVAGELSLRELLEGGSGFRDLLGLLTAARGGLTLADLEDLGTGLASFEIRAVLRDCSGSLVAVRDAAGAAGGGPVLEYQLASEAVQADAAAALGAGLLADYRRRLHEWAGRYRELGWPAGTPAYLICEYPGMLREAGEAGLLADCAADRARHNRMFVLSGGDLQAREEIAAAQAVLLARDDPDLHAMARLAVHRDELDDHGSLIPTDLAALWVTLGRPDRGENMVRSITSRDRRAQALAAVAAAQAAAGLHDKAQEASAAGDPAARSAPDHGTPAETLSAARSPAKDTSRSSDPRPGPGLADNAEAPLPALAARAVDLAAEGRYDLAEEIARSLADAGRQAHALTAVAQVMAADGMRERAGVIALAAEAAILTGSRRRRDQRLSELVIALAEAGERDQSSALSRQVLDREARARLRAVAAAESALARYAAASTHQLADSALQLAKAAADFAEAGLRYQSETAALGAVTAMCRLRANNWAHSANEVSSLAKGAAVLATGGLHGRAIQAFTIARQTALAVPKPASAQDPNERAMALKAVNSALGEGGLVLRAAPPPARTPRRVTWLFGPSPGAARRKARAAIRSASQSEDAALADVAQALAGHRYQEHAENVARCISDPRSQARTLTDVYRGLAQAAWDKAVKGQGSEAEKTARSIRHPAVQAQALADVALALSLTGRYQRAENVARSITNPQIQGQALAVVAIALGMDDRPSRSAEIALSISEQPLLQANALAVMATVPAPDKAEKTTRILPDAALESARSITNAAERADALAIMAVTFTAVGLNNSAAHAAIAAEAAARQVTSPHQQASALAAAAAAFATRPELGTSAPYRKRARSMIAMAWAKGPWGKPLYAASRIAPDVLGTITAMLASDTTRAK